MTEVNGLRLAYKGFVGGLAGGYVWVAVAMLLAALLHGDALRPLERIAGSLVPIAGRPDLAFVLGLLAVQGGGALVGMSFAYFFARFFTVRSTLAVAAPIVALLVWGLVAAGVHRLGPGAETAAAPIAVVATIAYGVILGAAVPIRGEVTRFLSAPT